MLKLDAYHETIVGWLASYNYLTLHRVPGPRSLTYFLPIAATFISLLVPPSLLSFSQMRYAALPLVVAVQIWIWQNHQSFDVISMQTCLTGFALLGWYDVRRQFKHIEHHATGPKEVPYPRTFVARMQWVGTLILSLQFTDFLIGARAHDLKQRQRKPVSTFAAYFGHTALRMVLSFLLLDVTSYLLQETNLFPCVTIKGHACPNKVRSVATDGLILFAHVYAAASFALAHLPTFAVLIAIAPFPGLRYHPSISPVVLDNLFGPISSIWQVQIRGWGLRAFWGTFWHQNLRYVTITPGLAFASALRLRRASLAWYTIVTSQAFFWSGCIHAGMVPPYPIGTSWSSTSLRLRVASFFWIQPVGILLESIIDGARGNTQNRLRRASGATTEVLHTILAMTWSAGFILVTLWATVLPVGRELGWWRLHPVPFSLSSLVVKAYKARAESTRVL